MKRQKHRESRRDFIRTSGLIAGTALASSFTAFSKTSSLISGDEQGGGNNFPEATDWINYFVETKLRLIEKRAKAKGVPMQPKRMRRGDKAFPYSIDLRGVDKLILSAMRGNQEGQWDYAVWGNARFIDSEGKSVWLDEIPFDYERTGHDGRPMMCVNDKKEVIRVAGKTYKHGVFCFADSVLAYSINGKHVRFEADIGIEDNSPKKGAAFFSASNVDITLEANEIYRRYPEQAGVLHAHSMWQGKNLRTVLMTPDASIERSITRELIKKLKGNLAPYEEKFDEAGNERDLRRQLVSYLSLFDLLRKRYQTQLALESRFSFAFLTDVHLYENNARGSSDGFTRALAQLKLRDVDFLLFGGDNAPVDHYKPGDERAVKHMEDFKAMVDKNEQKAYYTVGNHDLVFTDGYMDMKSLRVYEKVFGPVYYSFDHKGVHFIVLNSNEQDGKGNYIIGNEQTRWLKNDLDATGVDVPVVLSLHVPMLSLYYPAIEGRYVMSDGMFVNYKEIWDMLRSHNVRLVLQGHQHVYEEILTRKTRFVTGGAVCDNWWLGGGFGNTFSGYMMVHVDHENNFSWEYVCF